MKSKITVVTILVALTFCTIPSAQNRTSMSGPPLSTSFASSDDGYPLLAAPAKLSYRDGRRSKGDRILIMTGGLMLGLAWFTSVMIGAMVIEANEKVGARMMIPYVGTAEIGVEVINETGFFGFIFFVPTMVQVTGTGLLIAGLTIRARHKRAFYSSRLSAAPLIYRQGGGGLGVSFAM